MSAKQKAKSGACSEPSRAESSGGNPLGLPHPARTPMPEALRPSVASASGVRRVRRKAVSDYVASAWVSRAQRTGQVLGLADRLRALLAQVEAGANIVDGVADGTLWGWHTRQALGCALGENLVAWDGQIGRSRGERLALIRRALGELGATAPETLGPAKRRGGWSVS